MWGGGAGAGEGYWAKLGEKKGTGGADHAQSRPAAGAASRRRGRLTPPQGSFARALRERERREGRRGAGLGVQYSVFDHSDL